MLFQENQDGRPPKLEDLIAVMISYFQFYTSIFVFFDALDESTEEQKEMTLELIGKLCDAGMRVFLTSRPHLESDVRRFVSIVPYEIRAQDVDLDLFIRAELDQEHDERFPGLLVEDKEQLRATLIDNADGM
jgi:hypothetical protein